MSLSRTIASAVRPAVRARGYASAVAHSPIIRSELAETAFEKSPFLKDMAAVEAHGARAFPIKSPNYLSNDFRT